MYRIRPILPRDNAQAALIIRQVMTSFACAGPGYSIEDPEVDDMYSASQKPRSTYLVVGEKTIHGIGGIAPLAGGSPTVCELKKMYFVPEIRGQGIGKKMLLSLIEEAKRLQFKTIYLETVTRMTAANGLYRSVGFQSLTSSLGCTGHYGCDFYYSMDLTTFNP